MSKAIIIEHLGKGQYRVNLQRDLTSIKARITALTEKIAASNQRIGFDLQHDVDSKLKILNDIVIPSYPPEEIGTPAQVKEISELNKKIAEAKHNYEKSVKALTTEKILLENTLAEKGKLSAIEEQNELTIWCADYTTSLKPGDEVGVIDWYQFISKSTSSDPVIIPGYLTHKECFYNKIRDGRKVPEYGLSTSSWWYAQMILPGVERFNPLYRKGEITTINENGLTVSVDPIYTQVLHSQYTPLNDSELTLTNVPARYLSCNEAAFIVGDRVILEYPRKNIHEELIKVFEYKKQTLLTKKTKLEQKIAQYEQQIAIQQGLINQQQQIVTDKIKAVKDEQIANGVADLQLNIADLDEQIAALKISIDNYNSIASKASSEISTLNQSKSDLSNQKATAIYELSQLIANAASSGEIQLKQQQINDLDAQIALINSSITAQSAIESGANSHKTSEINQQNSLKSTKSIDEQDLFSILLLKTLIQQELDISLQNLAVKEQKKTSLQSDKLSINIQITDIELKILKLNTLIAEEQGKYTVLKAYTDTRPKEITVIGFIQNPRACQGLAYKNQIGDWRVVFPDGRDRALANPPALVGKYNWGVQNEDGTYDCACVWNGKIIRHLGYNYTLDDDINAAGVIKDINNKGLFIIKAVCGSIVHTLNVKDGFIVSKNYKNITGYWGGDILVDKSGLFAISAYKLDTISTISISVYNKKEITTVYSKIYLIDLISCISTLINDFYDFWKGVYVLENLYTDKINSITYTDTGLHIVDNKLCYQPNSMAYNENGDIEIIAMIDVSGGISSIVNYYYNEVYAKINFKDRNINRGNIVYNNSIIDDGNYTRFFESNQVLTSAIINNNLTPIYIKNKHHLNNPTHTTGGIKFDSIIYTDDLVIDNYQRSVTDLKLPSNGTFAYYHYEFMMTRTISAMQSKADIEGFSAGCIKIVIQHPLNMQQSIESMGMQTDPNYYIEFRGSEYKIVDYPSTDYTILI